VLGDDVTDVVSVRVHSVLSLNKESEVLLGVWVPGARCYWVCGCQERGVTGCVGARREVLLGVWVLGARCYWVCGCEERGVTGCVGDRSEVLLGVWVKGARCYWVCGC
jgi:hypothetical protein